MPDSLAPSLGELCELIHTNPPRGFRWEWCCSTESCSVFGDPVAPTGRRECESCREPLRRRKVAISTPA